MKRIFINTPENIEIEYRLAGVGSRVVAAFLDYLIQGCIYLAILLTLTKMADPIKYLEAQSSYTIAIVLLIMALINYGYFTFSEMVMDGRTLGKKVLGLRTIRKNGQPMDIKHSLIRNLFRIFVDNYLVGIIMMFFRNDTVRIGDIFSSTMVIEEERATLYLSENIFPESLRKKLTEEEKSLLLLYIEEKEDVMVEGEKLQEKIKIYFKNKYGPSDEEIMVFLEKNLPSHQSS